MTFEDIKSLFFCLFPRLRVPRKRNNDKKTITEQRREKIKKISSLQLSRSYRLKRDRILGRINFDFSRIVVVWGYGDNLPRMAIINQLQSYGEMTIVQDRWTVSEKGDKIWLGVLVEYERKIQAERASLDLPSRIKYIRSTMLETVMNTLADCELLHPECGENTPRVVIRRKVPLRIEEVNDLHRILHKFGGLATFFNSNRPTTIGALCEVSYAYLTQAYLAMIMTNGLLFCRGVVTTVIEKTEKDKEILKDAKDCMMLLSQCCFPS